MRLATNPQNVASAESAQAFAQTRFFKTKPTRKQILAMKFEELSALSLEELTELSSIVGVSSVDELLKLLVNTASKSDETVNDAPGVISVITAREIELFGARTLADVLNYMVSVQLYASTLFNTNFTIRGDLFRSSATKHVLVLINGRPLRESLFSGIYLQTLNGFPLQSVERIELLRGPGSVLYGTNAFTGTVNIITKKSNEVRFQARGGANGTIEASAFAGAGGKTPLGEARFDAGVLYNNNAPAWTFPFRVQGQGMGAPPREFSYTPSQRSLSGMVTASLGGFKGQVFITDYRANTLGPSPNQPPQPLTNFTLNADLCYSHQFSDALSATLNGTANIYNTRYAETMLSNDQLGELLVAYKPATTLQFLLGGLLNHRSGTQFFSTSANVIVPPYDQIWWAAYGEAEWKPLESLTLRLGAQVNKAVGIPLDIAPRAAVVWYITPELGVKALYGQAFRAAAGFENFSVARGGLGKSDLRPETNESLDAEIFWEQADMRLSAVWYRSWQVNLIAPRNVAPAGQPARNVHDNFGTFEIEGTEAELKYAPVNELYALASVSYQTNRDGPTQRDVTMLSTWMVKTGIGYDNKNGIAASLFNIFYSMPITGPLPMGAMPTANVNPPFGAFHLLSANVNLDITEIFDITSIPHITVHLRGENLLNTDAIWLPEISRRINSLPMFPGRGFYGGLSVRL